MCCVVSTGGAGCVGMGMGVQRGRIRRAVNVRMTAATLAPGTATHRASERLRRRQERKVARELKAIQDERIERERRRIAKKKRKVSKKERKRRPWRYINDDDKPKLPIFRPPIIEIPKRSYAEEEQMRQRLRRRCVCCAARCAVQSGAVGGTWPLGAD